MLNYIKLYTHHNAGGEPSGVVWETDNEGQAVTAVYAYSYKAGVWWCTYLPQIDEETETEEHVPSCDECGGVLDEDAIEHEGQAFCSRGCLADAGFIVMPDGDIVPEDDVCMTVDGEWQLVDDCVYITPVYRGRSEEGYYREDDDRVVQCDETGEYCLRYESSVMADGRRVSDSWVDDNAASCDGCGELYEYDDMQCTDDGYFCDGCAPSVRGRHVIKRYNADVIGFCGFAPNPRNARTYGVELEVENGDAEAVDDALDGEGILKEDGSLNDGFEIVTRPAPMADTIATITRAAKAAKASGSQSFNTNTCGFHVHIARKGLSELRIGKMLAFVQSSDCKRELEKVAQRSSSRWALMGENLKVTEKPTDRYTALNLQNAHTIELRIFKGTLHKESLIAYLTFTEALVEWSREVSLADCYRWESLVAWLKSQKAKKYQTLLAWMANKGCKV